MMFEGVRHIDRRHGVDPHNTHKLIHVRKLQGTWAVRREGRGVVDQQINPFAFKLCRQRVQRRFVGHIGMMEPDIAQRFELALAGRVETDRVNPPAVLYELPREFEGNAVVASGNQGRGHG